ncbi:Bug family tripartite tricarboxylate transporter substrate binding protein [Sabulicella glaciei]|uniref:Tripartite tricarboxylate transporter substrate binding protein n=1 Tax=Sabulicella glaciei TaxID=2984948 RepID=A0ABT3NTB5_9PROT|nr:tripartite tricarboxylate transporter substrate binding protein [Roseococcus sp. MDT2-1-1]MCW8085397.1 tripartite tricarboxylate transporter substrate binding protein [Roseococcus sp. MDT2-1-1]
MIARRALPLLALLPAAASAQERNWPSQPIRLIVPFAAGTSDTVARLVGLEMAKSLGVPVVVENRPGAGGNIGAEAVARAAPDGNTLVLGTISSHAINPAITPRMPYDNLRDFAPVTQLAAQPNAIVVPAASAIRDLPGLVAATRTNRGMPFGTSGVGTSVHLAGALFAQMTGTEIEHIPYRGSAQVTTALLSGELPLAFDNLSSVLPFAREGRMRILGVTSRDRAAAVPEIPAVAEALPGFESLSWHGIFAPARTPAPVVARLQREAVAALAMPLVAARFRELGITPVGSSPGEFAAFVASETARWGAVARAANIRLD